MIYDAYPKLQSREFKLLRVGSGLSCKQLIVIGSPSGMTVPYLKDILGQAKLYIRPDKDIESAMEDDPEVWLFIKLMCTGIYNYNYIATFIIFDFEKNVIHVLPCTNIVNVLSYQSE